MRADYERSRVADQIRRLESEQEQLNHALMRTEHDEQMEIEKLKQDFKKRISSMEFRKSAIVMEISNKKRELARIEERMKEDGIQFVSAVQQSKENRLKPHL